VVLELKIEVYIDIAKYPHIIFKRELALSFIASIIRRHGATKDLEEAKRVISNFDEYYGIAHRKSGGYLIIPKDSYDAVRGKVVVHKVKLSIENNEKIVEIILDRRVSKDLIESSLREIGFSEVEYVQTN